MNLISEHPDVINLILSTGVMILAGINLYMTLQSRK